LLSVLARRADEICASLEDGIAPAHDDGAARALHEQRHQNGASAGRMAFAL
ncbi:ornithine monooxygenase, partial [Burkholderia sp. SIMBA_013]